MNKLHAHFKRMQAMATAYITPERYTTMVPGAIPTSHDEGDVEARNELFIVDMIYMLDGPEQREAETEQREMQSDAQIMIRSLMRDLRVVDHVVVVDDERGKRTIMASRLIA
jgi:hypothetical protein